MPVITLDYHYNNKDNLRHYYCNLSRWVLKPSEVVILSGPTESIFYKFCRFVWLHKINEEDHKHTVYDIEKKFKISSLKMRFMLWNKDLSQEEQAIIESIIDEPLKELNYLETKKKHSVNENYE